jgi:hypothetical protein
MTECQSPSKQLIHRYREQARSYRGTLACQGLLTNPNQSVNNRTFDKPCLSFATSSQ